MLYEVTNSAFFFHLCIGKNIRSGFFDYTPPLKTPAIAGVFSGKISTLEEVLLGLFPPRVHCKFLIRV